MRKTIRALRGEVRAELLGGDTERLLNACANAALPLWNIESDESGALRLSLFEHDLPRLEKIALLCRCELNTLALHGGSRSARLLRARSRLAAFAALCALLLTLSGLFIWDFEVEGNEKLSRGEILRALADCGISEGCFWPTIDAERLRSDMLLRCDELAWMTLNVRGSRATVLVLERREKPEIYLESDAADLTAAKDGVIRELSVKNGKTLVSVGEIVTAGQTLVSAAMDSPTGETRFVRAEGSVRAETWPTKRVFFDCGAQGKEAEKGFRLIFGIRVGKSRINLVTNSRKELDECDKIVKEYTLGIDGLFHFPVGMIAEVYRPYRTTGEIAPNLSLAEASALAALEEETDGEVIAHTFDQTDGQLVLRAHCLENIALTEEKDNP